MRFNCQVESIVTEHFQANVQTTNNIYFPQTDINIPSKQNDT